MNSALVDLNWAMTQEMRASHVIIISSFSLHSCYCLFWKVFFLFLNYFVKIFLRTEKEEPLLGNSSFFFSPPFEFE